MKAIASLLLFAVLVRAPAAQAEDELARNAHEAFLAGDYYSAIHAYQHTTSQLGASRRLELAQSYVVTGDFDRALAIAQPISKDGASKGAALAVVGTVHARRGEWHAAAESYAAAAQADSSKPEIWLSLGQALQNDGQPTQAELAFAAYRTLRHR